MATVREFPLANYPTGIRTIVRQTPNGLTGFFVRIALCTSADPTIWPDPTSVLKITVENSFDGVTFPPKWGGAAFDTHGGIRTNRDGEVPFLDFPYNCAPLQPVAVRIGIEIINGPIRTFGEVTIN